MRTLLLIGLFCMCAASMGGAIAGPDGARRETDAQRIGIPCDGH